MIHIILSIFKQQQQTTKQFTMPVAAKNGKAGFYVVTSAALCAEKDKPNDIYVTAPRQVSLTPGTCPPFPHSQGSRRASKRLFKSVYSTVAQGVIHKRLQYM